MNRLNYEVCISAPVHVSQIFDVFWKMSRILSTVGLISPLTSDNKKLSQR